MEGIGHRGEDFIFRLVMRIGNTRRRPGRQRRDKPGGCIKPIGLECLEGKVDVALGLFGTNVGHGAGDGGHGHFLALGLVNSRFRIRVGILETLPIPALIEGNELNRSPTRGSRRVEFVIREFQPAQARE